MKIIVSSCLPALFHESWSVEDWEMKEVEDKEQEKVEKREALQALLNHGEDELALLEVHGGCEDDAWAA